MFLSYFFFSFRVHLVCDSCRSPASCHPPKYSPAVSLTSMLQTSQKGSRGGRIHRLHSNRSATLETSISSTRHSSFFFSSILSSIYTCVILNILYRGRREMRAFSLVPSPPSSKWFRHIAQELTHGTIVCCC